MRKVLAALTLALVAAGLTAPSGAGAEAEFTFTPIDIRPDEKSSSPSEITRLGHKAIFGARIPGRGREPAIVEGTDVRLLKDINPDGRSSWPRDFTKVGDRLYFHAYTPGHGDELWVTDGTRKGTVRITNLPGHHPWQDNQLSRLARFNGMLFFAFDELTDESEPMLWRSAGTAATTIPLAEIYRYGFPPFGRFRGALWFEGSDEHGVELWKTDGTPQGTVLVKDIALVGSSWPAHFRRIGDWLYFRAADDGSDFELFRTGGTADTTMQVAEVNPDLSPLHPAPGHPSNIATIEGRVVFSAYRDDVGTELFRLQDGKARLVKHIRPGTYDADETNHEPLGSRPSDFSLHDGVLLFLAYNAEGRHTVWRTDGTRRGTTQVGDVDRVYHLSRFAGRWWFSGCVGGHVNTVVCSGNEGVFTTDGTRAGTRLVADLDPDPSKGWTGEVVKVRPRVAYTDAGLSDLGHELVRIKRR